MDRPTAAEKWIFQYLLGELGPEEQARFEERMFEDEDFFDSMELLKDQLIEDYLEGRLAEPECRRFESRFLRSPNHRLEVDLTRTLMNLAARAPAFSGAAAGREPQKAPRERSRRISLLWPGLAAAALLSVAVLAIWAFMQTSRLESQLAQSRQREDQLREQTVQERRRLQELALQLDQSNNQQSSQSSGATSPIGRVFHSALFPTLRFRDVVEPPLRTLPIPTEAEWVRLDLEFEPDSEYRSCRALLHRRGEQSSLAIVGSLRPQKTSTGQTVSLGFMSSTLPQGDYRIVLEGILASGASERISEYDFRVVRP